jgi:hypothetical protein
MLFSTNKHLPFDSYSLLHQARACNASQRRDLTWELKGGTARLFSFPRKQ